jgi:enolase
LPDIKVQDVGALEILDSRGRPTLQVTVDLSDGSRGVAGVPSGASTGTREAVELRDGDPSRFGGSGVMKAAANVTGEIRDALAGKEFDGLAALDRALIALDGTDTKARLGANAVVGVSMAATAATAASAGLPVWGYLAQTAGTTASLPVPHFNVINGGVHAANALDFQEFMIAPVGAPSLAEAVRAGAEVYAALRRALTDRGMTTGLGDEGGFAPAISSPADALALLVEAIDSAGYTPGRDGIAIALDPAASEFASNGSYTVAEQQLSTKEMIEFYAELVGRFPIWSIEDGLAEDDWDGWVALTERLGEKVQLVGDDIFVTDPATIARGVQRGAGTAALIKVNQIGTVSQTLEALETCRDAGWAAMVSHRSGETCDTFIADLAVGIGCGQIKSGAPARGERAAKYNRLLAIAASEPDLRFGL